MQMRIEEKEAMSEQVMLYLKQFQLQTKDRLKKHPFFVSRKLVFFTRRKKLNAIAQENSHKTHFLQGEPVRGRHGRGRYARITPLHQLFAQRILGHCRHHLVNEVFNSKFLSLCIQLLRKMIRCETEKRPLCGRA